jgi:predicted RNase H-like nuclease (RuvC/YqgF family)
MAPRSPVVQRNDAITASSHTPASLLWGHQLKREHAFLLERMKKLEAEHHTFASRIVAAEAAAEAMSAAVDDVQRLTEEENSVDDARRAWIASAEERLGKLEDASEKARNLQVRIAELEARPTEFDGIEERLRRVEEEHRSVLPNQSVIQKLRAHDTELQALRRDIRRPSKSFSPTDIPVLKQRMEAVESRLDSGRNEEQKVRAMEIKIATLEKTCRAYNDKITELEARLHNSNVTRDYPLPSTEVPTQLLPSSYAADTQTLAVADPTIEVPTQILPSSNTEVPTQILPSSNTEVPTQILPSSNVTDVQVPASPPLGLRKEK